MLFIIAASQGPHIHNPLGLAGHRILLLGPVVEGLLGGYPTMQAVFNAYLSDSTAAGSRCVAFIHSFCSLGGMPLVYYLFYFTYYF